MAMPKTTRTSGQALSGERQLAVKAMPYTTWPSGQALSGEIQLAVSGNALDHLAIGAGTEW